MKDAVTVVIPAFNRSETIGRALDSVIRQTHSNWEAIVTDDGSTDSTAQIVQNYSERESRIRLLNHTQQLGAQAARNTAIRAAKGEWIAFLDSDDELVSTSLEIRLKAANENHVQVVHSQCTFVSRDA